MAAQSSQSGSEHAGQAPAVRAAPFRLSPYLALVLLGLVFFVPLVVHPGWVIYSEHSDLLALHLPGGRFLVRSWQETGELPHWCPYCFSGRPSFHDGFYPLHWPIHFLPEDWLGASLSWLIVTHVLLAGCCMFAYARGQGLEDKAALAAGCAYMFGGKWLLHLLAAGHYQIGLAWLPLLLLLLERALQRHSFWYATLAGMVYALLLFVCHPQWAFYAGLLIAGWTLAPVLEEAGFLGGVGERSVRRTRAALGRWLGFGVWTAVLGVALAAIFMLPILDYSRETTRSLGVSAGIMLVLCQQTFLSLVGPALTDNPPTWIWEERSGLGIVIASAAAMAPVLCPTPRVRFQAGVCLVLVLFALGGALVLQWLPVFNMFRQPSRMLLIAALPIAFLTGVSTQALFTAPGPDREARRLCRLILLGMLVLAAAGASAMAYLIHLQNDAFLFHPYWGALLLTVPVMFWLLGAPPSPLRHWFWLGLLLVDLWALAWPYLQVRPEADIYTPSACIRFLDENKAGQGRVLDFEWKRKKDLPAPPSNPEDAEETMCSPLGRGAPLALLLELEPIKGYMPIDILRYKEYLQFIADVDEPLIPFTSDRFFLSYPVIGDVPIANKSLLDLLGVRYILQPTGQPPPLGCRAVFEDPHPRAYDFWKGGMQDQPGYTVYENPGALPRAFVVHEAEPLPEPSKVLQKLKATDFRREVLLERPRPGRASAPAIESLATKPASNHFPERTARIKEYQPNRVVVAVDKGAPGYLVLTDIWYPGWQCTAAGEPVEVLRADYLFRAVQVPAEAHEVVFTFAPQAYRLGKTISLAALALAALIVLAPFLARMSSRSS